MALTPVGARLDPVTLAIGVAVQAAITVPPVLMVRALTQDDVGAQSYLPLIPAVLGLLVAPAVAGVVTGRRRPEAPMLHAAASTTAAWVVLTLVTLARLSIAGHGLARPLSFILTFAPIEVGIGVLGGFFASRVGRRPPAGVDPDTEATEALDQPA